MVVHRVMKSYSALGGGATQVREGLTLIGDLWRNRIRYWTSMYEVF